ncbi:branched-chain amino acid aminotransferase [Actinomycetospora chlora]|uniref:branched-chain-amino-acid transaminase n=1 Tax=Actinomycetospora chlora TaxID=663608 RepID=A0ABP9ACN8_9PSEU
MSIDVRTPAERDAILADPGFGRHVTDHMVVADWSSTGGWTVPRVTPYGPLTLQPSAAVLHYSQEIFEGLKAYRHADGGIHLFRPERNARRFAASARMLALPELAEQDFLDAVAALLRADHAWVPDGTGERSLYLRPFTVATEPFLGVRAAAEATFAVIGGPAGAYFPGGVTGIGLWVSTEHSRAAPGGTGAAKCGGNYAAGLAAQAEAKARGCDQVLFLDATEHRWLEEAGTMNVVVVTADGTLATPPLGTILDGVTRHSVLTLAPEHGLVPVERPIAIDEVLRGCADGSVTEVFAVGTAAVVTPVTSLVHAGVTTTVGDGAPGPHALAIREHLTDIQYGRAADVHGWMRRVV